MAITRSPSFPLPLCVQANTSAVRPALTPAEAQNLGGDLPGADARSKNETVLGVAYSVDNPMDLSEAGWGVIFPFNPDPALQARTDAIKAQLKPLLDLRHTQVQSSRLFQVFDGPTLGVTPGLSANSWAVSRGVSLTAPVDPYKGGVPFYLLIIGSPEDISFEFQALLKMQWAVGRLHFDDPEDYGRYARAVVEYESPAYTPVQRKNVAVWMTRNEDDDATLMLSSALAQDFLDPDSPLGSGKANFSVDAFVAEKATKAQLAEILRGNLPGGPPAVIFTGSHGTQYPPADPHLRERQGALITQEWLPGAAVGTANQFAGEDIPADAQLQGTFAFLFACFGGGCPQNDSYSWNPDGSPRQIAPVPMISRLPQVLLARGVLAVFAHLDVAYAYSFADGNDTPQPQVIRTPLELLMRGKRAGLAGDSFTSLWSALAIQVSESTPRALGVAARAPELAAFANLSIARDDARNYLVLGDPAVCLRVKDLS